MLSHEKQVEETRRLLALAEPLPANHNRTETMHEATSLVIPWQVDQALTRVDSWYSWTEDLCRDAQTEATGALPASLASTPARGLFPAATGAILHRAFEAKLSRFCGWDLSRVAPQRRASYYAAAAVYKRGVAVRPCPQQQAQQPLPAAAHGAYPLYFYPRRYDFLASSTAALPHLATSFRVCDAGLAALWPELKQPGSFIFSATEANKTLASVACLHAFWVAQGRPRHWLIFGGGLTMDLAAFTAKLCGANFTLIPTTLLGMADASIGGKTGVNAFPYGKNQLGAFAFADAVHIWSGFLATLPQAQLRAGGAECLKHAFLAGAKTLAQQLAQALADADLDQLSSLLPAVVKVKADVVAEDTSEQGRRATLNLGHTLAHALEALAQEKPPVAGAEELLHGEAVAVGLCFCLYLAKALELLPNPCFAEMLAILKTADILPTPAALAGKLGVSYASLSSAGFWDKLAFYLGYDKKNTGPADATREPELRWILLEGWGNIVKEKPASYSFAVPLSFTKNLWPQFITSYLGYF